MKSKIQARACRRGLNTAYALAKATKMPPNVAYKLWHGNYKMIGLGTLSKLCSVLECQPGALLEYEGDSNQ